MTLLLAVLAVALGGAAAWVWRLRALASIAAGYKAKVLCSTIFVSGRDIDPARAPEIAADSYRVLRPFRASVDRSRRTVTVSLAGLSPRTATYADGLGATLTKRGREVIPSAGRPARSTGDPRRSKYLPSPFSSSTIAARLGATLTGGREVIPPAGRPARSTGDPRRSKYLPSPFSPNAWPERPGPPALQRIVDDAFAEPDPNRLRRTRAVIVVRDGGIVAERYASGFGRDTRLPGWSMTKSVLAAPIGVFVGEGGVALDDRELMPDWRAPDPRADITVEDLLRMRSGLSFSEAYADPWSDVVQMLFNCRDAAAYAAALPLSARPGTEWAYSSGTTNILSAILRHRLGDAAYLGYPRRVLFDPIGMRSAILEPDASGTFVGSSFMFATARDWARFGQLWLDDGLWAGRRILPEGWVRFSTTPTPQSPGGKYGAHWWLRLNPELGGGTAADARIPRDAFHALGHEGQALTIVPSRRLVVVRLGLSIYIDAWNHARFLADLIDVMGP